MASSDISRIAGNIGALNALKSLEDINSKLALHQSRLSSGKQINSAADDPAGLTIATKMLARSEGLKTATSNIGDALNMLSVAEAGMGKMNDILVTMRSKAEQAASDTLGASERQAIQVQLSSYAEQIQNIVDETKWNGVKLLDGTVNKQFQTGADKGEFTTWVAGQSLDPTALQISTNDSTGAVNVSAPLTSFTAAPVVSGAVESGYTGLATGRYSINIADTAASSTVGKVNNLNNVWAGSITNVVAIAPSGTELAKNGTYTITVKTVGAAGSFSIVGPDGTPLADVTGKTTTGNANIDLGNGVQIQHSGDLTVGQTLSVEYIQKGNVKYQLKDGSGGVVQVDADGAGVGTAKASYGYFDATSGAAKDTGVGVTFGAATMAGASTFVAGDTATFDYKKANKYGVDVSTASKAADYMDTVNNAIGLVSSSLATLGSLAARLQFKSDQTTTAQINVEASYNRIMNANMAEEQVQASKFAILQQVATSMLAQANAAPQALLALFR